MARVKYSSIARWFSVESKGGEKIRLSTYMAGMTNFMRLCEEQLDSSQYAEAFEDYHRTEERSAF